MTENSGDILKFLLKTVEKAPKRIMGHKSEKKGRDYENKASFFILKHFNELLQVKSEIVKLVFNGLDDLHIIDNKGRIFSFEIKCRNDVLSPSKVEEFLINCLNGFKALKESDKRGDVNYYFFTNTTGNFLEEWNRYHIDDPDQLHSHPKLPDKVKEKLNNSSFSKEEKDDIFSRIHFLADQTDTVLKPYLDRYLFKKFVEYKGKQDIGDIIDFKKLNLLISKIDPIIEKNRESYFTFVILILLFILTTVFNPSASIRILGLSIYFSLFCLFQLKYVYDIKKEKKKENKKINNKYLVGIILTITVEFVFISLISALSNIRYGDLILRFIYIAIIPVLIPFYYWTRKHLTPVFLSLLYKIFGF